MQNGVATTVNDGLVDIVMGNHDIDIIGGKWEGNSEGQTSWMVIMRLMGNDLTLSEAIINNSRGDCIFSRAPRNKVFNNNIGYCQDTGIVMGGLKTATNASYGKGYNNYIHDSVVGLDMSNDADYVEYYANTLRNITANGISVTYTVNGNRPPHHGKIFNNVLDYAGGNESGKCGINVVYGSVNDILIEGNTVNFASRNGICGNTEGVNIINNFVNNTFWNGINLAGDNNTVYGNTISGSSRDAPQQASAMLIYGKHNIIENNKIYDNQTIATQYKGIVEISGADYNIIRNNKIGDTAGGAKITILGGNTTNIDNYGTGGYRWGILTSKPTNSNIDDEYTNSTSHLKCYKVNSTTWINLQNWTSIGC